MQQTIEYLYNRFLTGMKPTQQDFRDLMDSFFHKADLDATLQRLEAISLGEGEAWQVDNALDEGSIQPVQNKVVAARLRQLAGINYIKPHYKAKTAHDDKHHSNDHNQR